MVPGSVSPPESFNAAIAQLESTERALVAHQAAVTTQLEATRAALKALRALSPTPPPVVRAVRHAPRPMARAALAPALQPGPAGHEAARAREAELLRLIAAGTARTAQLRAALPKPASLTAEQHVRSVANALNRMSAAGLISIGEHGWSPTAKGRKAVEQSTKEAP